VGSLFSPWLEAHCATATLNRQHVESGCEFGLKRFAHLWGEKAKGQEKETLFVDLGGNLFEAGRYQQEESISTGHFWYAFLLIKPEEMVITMIRKSKAKLQFCK